MTDEDAKLLLKAAFEASRVLEIAAADLSDRLPRDEAKSVRVNIGHVLTEIGDRMFDTTFHEPPHFRPADTDAAWQALRQTVGAQDKI